MIKETKFYSFIWKLIKKTDRAVRVLNVEDSDGLASVESIWASLGDNTV